MKTPTTPPEITSKITALCNSIAPSKPQYIPVHPTANCKINDCFHNVDMVVQQNGGASVLGWTIWQRANVLIEAEAHSVWKSPQGNLVDITPHSHNEEQILFLEDHSIHYYNKPIPSRRVPLSPSPLVQEFIALFDERDKIMAEATGKQYSIPVNMLSCMVELEQIFQTKVGRNELCPCGSGLKYKRCCGPFE